MSSASALLFMSEVNGARLSRPRWTARAYSCSAGSRIVPAPSSSSISRKFCGAVALTSGTCCAVSASQMCSCWSPAYSRSSRRSWRSLSSTLVVTADSDRGRLRSNSLMISAGTSRSSLPWDFRTRRGTIHFWPSRRVAMSSHADVSISNRSTNQNATSCGSVSPVDQPRRWLTQRTCRFRAVRKYPPLSPARIWVSSL